MTAGRFLRCVVLLALCGIPLGAWWWAVSPASVSKWSGSGFVPVQTEPDAFIAADVQFGLWMLVFGVAAAWFLRRRWSATSGWALLALTLGTLGAAAIAALVGGILGPTDTPDVLVGTRVDGPLRVRASGLLLIGPIAAVAWWFAADLAASWRDDSDDADDSDADGAGDGASDGGSTVGDEGKGEVEGEGEVEVEGEGEVEVEVEVEPATARPGAATRDRSVPSSPA